MLRLALKQLLTLVFLLTAMSTTAQDTRALYKDTAVPIDGKPYLFKLMEPENVAADRKFPLVVFLHGAGERGADNSIHLKFFPLDLATPEMRTKYPCYVLAPQCEANKQWVDAPWADKVAKPMAPEPSEMMKCAIAAIVQTMKLPNVDLKRVYLTGISMGGYGSWELAMRHPEWFAAVAPICGGGDESKVAVLKPVPIWTFHGTADQAIPIERTQRLVDALTSAGGNVKFTKLEGVGHNVWDHAYDPKAGMLDWMFAQKNRNQARSLRGMLS